MLRPYAEDHSVIARYVNDPLLVYPTIREFIPTCMRKSGAKLFIITQHNHAHECTGINIKCKCHISWPSTLLRILSYDEANFHTDLFWKFMWIHDIPTAVWDFMMSFTFLKNLILSQLTLRFQHSLSHLNEAQIFNVAQYGSCSSDRYYVTNQRQYIIFSYESLLNTCQATLIGRGKIRLMRFKSRKKAGGCRDEFLRGSPSITEHKISHFSMNDFSIWSMY